MGRNLNLSDMLALPNRLICPKCSKLSDQSDNFSDYDIDGCNPIIGKWKLTCYCDNCGYQWEQNFQINSVPTEKDLLEEFKKLFLEADFQGLIRMGAPKDEYDSEAKSVYELVRPTDTVLEIQKKIWDIFYNNFCVGYGGITTSQYKIIKMSHRQAIKMIGKLENYKDIAEKIKKLIGD